MLSSTYKPAISATVTHAPGATLRDSPSLAGSRIKRIAEGEAYSVLGRTADAVWLLLQAEGRCGWVWSYHLHLNAQVHTLPIVSE